MKNKKIYKIGLALLIAIAFLLPTGSMAEVGESEAGDGQRFSVTEDNGQMISPLAWWNSRIYLTDMTSLMGVMAEGCYDLTVEIVKENDTTPPIEDCDIKLFLDIWKHDAAENEEIYCTDFEDPADVYNHWDSIDGGATGNVGVGDGGVDTFTWTDQRSHSPSHSFRCTIFDDHYMGNQEDYLQTYIEFEEYGELEVIFWNWCEGEEIELDDGGGGTSLEDYGEVEYSYDGLTWTTIGSPIWDTEGEWEQVSVNITDATGESSVYVRWKWTTGPTIQNEGWYIDDVCVYGREETGWGTRIFDTYTPHAETVDTDCMEYTFPEQYCFDEGEYSIRVWVLTETPKCTSMFPQDDPFWFNFTVGDAIDIAVTVNTIVGEPFDMGDTLLVETTVLNEGTLDVTDLPVTFSVKEQINTLLFQEFFENEADFPEEYDDWVNWEVSNWDGPDLYHLDEVDSVSPTHSLAFFDETSLYYPFDTFQAVKLYDINMEDYLDVIEMDIEFFINYRTNVLDAIIPVLYWPGHALFHNNPAVFLTGDSGGWTQMSFVDWFGFYLGDETLPEYFVREADERGWDPTECSVGWGLIDADAFDNTHGLTSGPWSGYMMDNVKWFTVKEGAERFKEIVVIPELKAASISDPAEFEDIEFIWDDMPTGSFVETKSVPDDDDDTDNSMSDTFEVETTISTWDEVDIETYDLTEDYLNHWHITTSGYDQYLWCGDEAQGTYDDNYNDGLLFAPDGDPSLDMGGLSQVTLTYDEYAHTEIGADYGIIEVYPYMDNSPGYQWYQYTPAVVSQFFDDFEANVPPAAPGGWALTGPNPWTTYTYGTHPSGFDPAGSPIVSANANSFPAPFTGSMWIGPYDLSAYTYGRVDFAALYLNVAPWGIDGQVNAYSGGMTPSDFEATVVDMNNWVADGFIGWPAVSSSFDITGFVDTMNVYFEVFYDCPAVHPWATFCVDDFEVFGSDTPTPAVGEIDWTALTYILKPGNLINPYTAGTFASEIDTVFTDEMGLRFRFISDEGTNYRGWLVDNLKVTGSDIFEEDPCDTMDNFLLDNVVGGDWWYYDIGYGGYICEDIILDAIPNDVDCALVWDTGVPQAMEATLHFNHDFDLEMGYDFCYLEFSVDGGNSWVAPVRFSGVGGGDYEIDMTAFIGDDILIRWRVETDESTVSDVYMVKEAYITGKIDTNAPITIGTLTGTVLHGWYSTPVTFTATATDDVSGVAATYYKIDGGSQLTYTGPITISVNGNHYIEYWSVDNVGNEETHHTTDTFKIDSGDAPSVAITAPGDGLYLFGNQLLSLSGRTIIIGGFTVEATASDSDSGVYRVQFALDGTVFGESTASPYSAYCGEKHTGAGTIQVTAEDFTGNTASASKDITYFKFL